MASDFLELRGVVEDHQTDAKTTGGLEVADGLGGVGVDDAVGGMTSGKDEFHLSRRGAVEGTTQGLQNTNQHRLRIALDGVPRLNGGEMLFPEMNTTKDCGKVHKKLRTLERLGWQTLQMILQRLV
jgi:hypothetical protein